VRISNSGNKPVFLLPYQYIIISANHLKQWFTTFSCLQPSKQNIPYGSCGDQGNCSKIPWKPSKKQCDQIKQIIFAPATWAEELSNFLVFILFWKNEIVYINLGRFGDHFQLCMTGDFY
jgi:hypothetical protein